MTVAFWISTTFVTVLFGCYMAGATWNCCCLSQCTFCIFLIICHTTKHQFRATLTDSDSIWRHIHRVHVCLAATCTVSVNIMTGIFYVLLQYHRGGTDTKIKVGTESWPWKRKFSCHSCHDWNLQPLNHESSTLSLSYHCSFVVLFSTYFIKICTLTELVFVTSCDKRGTKCYFGHPESQTPAWPRKSPVSQI